MTTNGWKAVVSKANVYLVDFLVILLLPLGAFIAFVTIILAAAMGRSRPKLIWPLAVSSFIFLPEWLAAPSEPLLDWGVAGLILMAWLAMGTLLGAGIASFALSLFRMLRRKRPQ